MPALCVKQLARLKEFYTFVTIEPLLSTAYECLFTIDPPQ